MEMGNFFENEQLSSEIPLKNVKTTNCSFDELCEWHKTKRVLYFPCAPSTIKNFEEKIPKT